MQRPPILLSFLLLTAIAAGCASSRKYTEELSATGGPPPGLLNEEEEVSDRKILFSAYLELAVENPDSTSRRIAGIAEKHGGYVNETGTSRTVIRVESSQFDAAITAIAALGKLRRRNIAGQDVTEEYQDYHIRLENAERARHRYLELLGKAETVEEILQVERELERLNETIDLLKGKMARIEHLEAFSTISVELRERKKPGLLGYIGLGAYYAVKWLFVRN